MSAFCKDTGKPCETKNCFQECNIGTYDPMTDQEQIEKYGKLFVQRAGQKEAVIRDGVLANQETASHDEKKLLHLADPKLFPETSKKHKNVTALTQLPEVKYAEHKNEMAKMIAKVLHDDDNWQRYLGVAKEMAFYEYQAFVRGVHSKSLITQFLHYRGKKIHFIPSTKEMTRKLIEYGYMPEFDKELGYTEY